MRRTDIDVSSLVDRIDRREIRLPEIQRAYVWKATQIAGLLDSLYQGYPSGSLLFWEPLEEVVERQLSVERDTKPLTKTVQYLLDGQQRLTSLHRVFSGHVDAEAVFNVNTETFKMRSTSTSLKSGWVPVGALLRNEFDAQDAIYTGSIGLDEDVDRHLASTRLTDLKAIGRYQYHVEILDDHSYEEVTEIFVRVNSKGRTLKTHDLALATMSARWPGIVGRLSSLADELRDQGFGDLDEAWLLRLLAGVTTESGTFASLKKAPMARIETGWQVAIRGARHLVELLRNRLNLPSSRLATSDTSLIPVAAFLGLRADEPLGRTEANTVLYWMTAAWVRLRYSAGKETRLGEDLRAIQSPRPLEALLARSGLDRRPLLIEADDLRHKGKVLSDSLFGDEGVGWRHVEWR